MNIKIKDFEFSGIKNIENDLKMEFFTNQNNSNEKISKNHIQGIYGPNGSGKTAFVQAMKLYKNLAQTYDFLIMNKKKLDILMNKNTNLIKLKITFLITNENKNGKNAQTIEHELKIDENFNIVYENIKTTRSELKVEKGEIVKNTFVSEKEFNDKFINLLGKSSFTSIYLNKIKEIEANKVLTRLIIAILNMNIVSEEKDEIDMDLNIFEQYVKEDDIKNFPINKTDKNILKINRISGSSLKEYEKSLDEIAMFLKIFKKNVKSIDVSYELVLEEEKNIDGNKKGEKIYKPTIFINYGSEKINVDYESTGIKKLINLYENINQLINYDEILIIDEFDAHLHDIVLNELIKYIIEMDKGQFIFTTHNLSTMDTLKDKKDSICILDLEGKKLLWTKKGNTSPKKAYKYGYLTEDFEYDFFSLYEVFDNEKE